DSGGISVTGKTPQERGFRDEEAHRTPHGTRPLGTENSVYQASFSCIDIYKNDISEIPFYSFIEKGILFHQRHILYNLNYSYSFLFILV
uniref:hypothetical protein n=1 Tax=Paenisporosarcina sp. TG-14 TaxID=1231057 RepID=UPI001ED9948E